MKITCWKTIEKFYNNRGCQFIFSWVEDLRFSNSRICRQVLLKTSQNYERECTWFKYRHPDMLYSTYVRRFMRTSTDIERWRTHWFHGVLHPVIWIRPFQLSPSTPHTRTDAYGHTTFLCKKYNRAITKK